MSERLGRGSFTRWFPLVALLATAVPACADHPSEGSERISTARQAVGTGTTDDANDFPHTAALRRPLEGNNAICSSFLASRRFVVTAAHCIDDPARDLDAVFATFEATVDSGDPRLVSHRFNKANPILAHIPASEFNETSNRDRARDVAVIRMDTRVSVVNPIRP